MGICMGTIGDSPALPAFSEDMLKIEISGPEVSPAFAHFLTGLIPVTANPPYRYRRAGDI